MAYPILRFVDQPTTGATTRFDLNTDPIRVASEGFSIGAPQLEGEPGATGRRWGERQLTLTLLIAGNRATTHTAIADFSRELLRRSNWLMFQPTSLAKPLWFRTWMTQPGEIDFENVKMAGTNDDAKVSRWEISVTLDADPWAYGAYQTLASATINNDTAAGTNPCRYTLPAIIGDAPAPARIRIVGDLRGDKTFVSIMGSDDAPTNTIFPVWVSSGTDTTTASGSEASGGAMAVISFGTNTGMVSRMVFSGPTLRHGSYRVLARVKSSTVCTARVQIRPSATAPLVLTDQTFTTGAEWNYVSLGTLDWPPAGRVEDDFLTTTSSSVALTLLAQRTANSGNLTVDFLTFVPVTVEDDDAETLIATNPSATVTPSATIIDGDTRSVRLVSASDAVLSANSAGYQEGEFPRVVPGVTNVLRLFATMAKDTGGDDLTSSVSVTVSYQPRWLYLADA